MTSNLKKTEHPSYLVWASMKSRCYNKKSPNYHLYGERGVKVCARWLNDFWAFAEDMGERESTLYQIDRIDNDGNYEPSNCRWATPHENSNNSRKYFKIELTADEYQTLRKMTGGEAGGMPVTKYLRSVINRELRQYRIDRHREKKLKRAKRKEQ